MYFQIKLKLIRIKILDEVKHMPYKPLMEDTCQIKLEKLKFRA